MTAAAWCLGKFWCRLPVLRGHCADGAWQWAADGKEGEQGPWAVSSCCLTPRDSLPAWPLLLRPPALDSGPEGPCCCPPPPGRWGWWQGLAALPLNMALEGTSSPQPLLPSAAAPSQHSRGCLELFWGEAPSPLVPLHLGCHQLGPSEPPAAWCQQPRLIQHRARALLPPAFNSRGSNELEQRSMLSGLLLCGLDFDMRKTLHT